MIFCDDIWKVIKSYLLDINDTNRRLFIKQLNNESQKRNEIYKNNLFKLKISKLLYEMYLKDLSEKKLNFRLAIC